MSEVRFDKNLKPCPFCGCVGVNVLKHRVYACGNPECEESWKGGIHTSIWQKRPIEDQLRADLAAAEKHLCSLMTEIAPLYDDYEKFGPLFKNKLKTTIYMPTFAACMDRAREYLRSKESSKGGGNDL